MNIVKIKFISGPMKGQCVELAPGTTTVGREEKSCGLHVDDYTLSRQHCSLGLEDNGILTVSDCRSKNGTKINGEKISQTVRLNSGDKVSLGETEFLVEINKPVEEYPDDGGEQDADSTIQGGPVDYGEDGTAMPTMATIKTEGNISEPPISDSEEQTIPGTPLNSEGDTEEKTIPEADGEKGEVSEADLPTSATLTPDHNGSADSAADNDEDLKTVSEPNDSADSPDIGAISKETGEAATAYSTLQVAPGDVKGVGNGEVSFKKILGIIVGCLVLAVFFLFLVGRTGGRESADVEDKTAASFFENDYIKIGRPGNWSMEDIRGGIAFKEPQGNALIMFHTTTGAGNAYRGIDLNPRIIERFTEEVLRNTDGIGGGIEFISPADNETEGSIQAKELWGQIPVAFWHFSTGNYIGTGKQFYVKDLRVIYLGLWNKDRGNDFSEFLSGQFINYLELKGKYDQPLFLRPVVDTSEEFQRPWDVMESAREAMDYAMELWNTRRHEDSSVEKAIEYYKAGLELVARCDDYPAWVEDHMREFFRLLEFRRKRLYALQSEIIQSETMGEAERARRLCEDLERLAVRQVETYFRSWARDRKTHMQ